MNVRFLREATTELDDAFKYYESQRTGLGVEFAAAVRDGIVRIDEYPKAWQLRGKRARCFSLDRFPYGIIYVSLPLEIVIVSIMHSRRKPNCWIGRLKTM
jgi:plasmid stabilization system protein ParE